MLNLSKGITMHKETKLIDRRKYSVNYPKYRIIKDNFDKIVEEGEIKMSFIKNWENEEENNKKQIREEKIFEKEQKNLINLEKKEEKRNKWIANKEKNNLIKKMQMHELSQEKMLKHIKFL